MNRRSPDARAPAVLLALGCVWGASFLFIKVLVDDTGPLEVATGRLCIGAVAILSFIRLRGLPVPWTPSLVAKVSVLALVANIAPFALIAWGEEHIESGTASVLNSTMRSSRPSSRHRFCRRSGSRQRAPEGWWLVFWGFLF